jgi:hypothetical protein
MSNRLVRDLNGGLDGVIVNMRVKIIQVVLERVSR